MKKGEVTLGVGYRGRRIVCRWYPVGWNYRIELLPKRESFTYPVRVSEAYRLAVEWGADRIVLQHRVVSPRARVAQQSASLPPRSTERSRPGRSE